jgi:cation diffusion facilitator CzcD-associated flavoprotein CzcO
MLIIGAGLSGIDAACRFQMGSPGRSYKVLEARDAIGGTWDLFRYPGVRSDSDMVTLGFPFHPWRGEKSIVDGGDIRDYVAETAKAFGIDRHIRFGHLATKASWSSADALWTVEVATGLGLKIFSCRFLFMCSGYYDYEQGHAPVWPGADEFGGRIVHPQFWPEDLDYVGKRVVVIGSGATAVTLVPAMAREAAHVTMLQRSPTYIVALPGRDRKAQWLRRWLPRFLADPVIRWKNILYSILTYRFARSRPDRMRAIIRAGVQQQLGAGYDVDRHFNPRYNPWDQRLCIVPDGDLFQVIREGRASIVTDEIARVTPDGLELKSGDRLSADIIVTATGLSIKLLGGMQLLVDGEAAELGGRLVYKGAMVEGIPNFAFAFGYTNASWTLKCDLTARMVSRIVNHMIRRSFDMVMPIHGDPAAERQSLLDFSSGYVQRASNLLPMQGARVPWRVPQNYLLDLFAHKTSRLSSGALRFSRRSPGGSDPA